MLFSEFIVRIESMYTALGLDSSATMWDEFAEEFIAQND